MSHDKLNMLHAHYCHDYDHQTWQSGYIVWGASFHKAIKYHDNVVLQGQRNTLNNTLYLYYHEAYAMVNKLGKMVSYCKELLCIKSHNPLNTQSHEDTWQINYVISLLPRENDFHIKCDKAVTF